MTWRLLMPCWMPPGKKVIVVMQEKPRPPSRLRWRITIHVLRLWHASAVFPCARVITLSLSMKRPIPNLIPHVFPISNAGDFDHGHFFPCGSTAFKASGHEPPATLVFGHAERCRRADSGGTDLAARLSQLHAGASTCAGVA